MTTETQAYLAESASAGQYSTATILEGLREFVPHLNNAAEQATAQRRLLQLASMAETDGAVAGLFEEAFMHIRTVIRLSAEVQQATLEMGRVLSQLDAVNARIGQAGGAS